FFFSSRRRHTRSKRDWSSDVCSSDLQLNPQLLRWPFFVEGSSTFSFGQGGQRNNWGFNWPGPTYFYSRRIGRALSVGAPPGGFEIGRASCREGVGRRGCGGLLKAEDV